MTHLLPAEMLNRPMRVHVIGCGGTGGHIASGLARLHLTMLEFGHEHGLEVTIWDDDIVEEHNVGRQLFFKPDVGLNKATVMVHRLNVAYGMKWKARAERFGDQQFHNVDMIIGCVDTKASRREIRRYVERAQACYWLDLGNTSKSGQALIGLGGWKGRSGSSFLPLPTDFLPELVDGEEDVQTPTCSVRASITRQGLFLNQQVAGWGLELCFQLFCKGKLAWQGVFLNSESPAVTHLKVDPVEWARFGIKRPELEQAA